MQEKLIFLLLTMNQSKVGAPGEVVYQGQGLTKPKKGFSAPGVPASGKFQ